MFVGLYEVALLGPVPESPTEDQYDCRLSDALNEYVGRLFVQWGDTPNSKRAWIQRADNQNKPIVELRQEYREEAFPGCTKFTRSLSEIETLPTSWKAVLSEARGVYVLTCPRTREQYVGSASGDDGFLGRWLGYVATGHGGNVALKHRDPSDFVISILEVAGSTASVPDIVAMEEAWKRRLLSREIGLNR